MRDETSSTHHPGTGLLAAFAQNALSAQERHSILLHLGECARCRDIVFLAQKAALAEMPVAAAPARRPRPHHGWPLVASALAALLIAAVSMVWVQYRLRSPSENGTIALGSQPPARAANPAARAPQAAPPPPEGTARHVPPSAASRSLPPRAPFANPPPAPSAASELETPPAPATSLAAARESAMLKSGMRMEARAEKNEKQEQLRAQGMEAEQLRRQATMKSENALAPRAAIEVPGAPAMGTSAGSIKQGNPAFAADANAASYSRPAYSMDEMSAPSAAAALPMAAKPRAPLPSGLRAVSTVRVDGRTLALDAAGALFAFEDNGGSWQSLATPCTGKALRLRELPSSASSLPVGNRAEEGTQAGEGAVEVLCATQQRQERWISRDRGQSWTLASPPTPEQR